MRPTCTCSFFEGETQDKSNCSAAKPRRNPPTVNIQFYQDIFPVCVWFNMGRMPAHQNACKQSIPCCQNGYNNPGLQFMLILLLLQGPVIIKINIIHACINFQMSQPESILHLRMENLTIGRRNDNTLQMGYH